MNNLKNSRKYFLETISIEEAKNRFLSHFSPSKTVESVPIFEAYSRVLAENTRSKTDVPPFDRASMDGYSVISRDTWGADEENPVVLEIIGEIGPGEIPKIEVEPGKCLDIATGAVMPRGANAVVMVEYTDRKEDKIFIYKPVAPGENVYPAGKDIMAGELLIRKGTVLSAREIGVLSAIGLYEIPVYKKPKVAVISTGNEIVEPGNPLPPGKIYDINAGTIIASVKECGGDPVFLGIIKDDPEHLREKIEKALTFSDMIIFSGGTSKGLGDFSYRVLDEIGKPGILVHGISIQPGKPTIIAIIGEKPVFGLPGYPTSALTVFNLLVAPIIRQISGKTEIPHATLKAEMVVKINTESGRTLLQPVHLIKRHEKLQAYPILKGSGAISTLAEADGYTKIPPEKQFIEEGEEVFVELFGEISLPDLIFIGSNDFCVNTIFESMLEKDPNLKIKAINVGSEGGIRAIAVGQTDISGIHLLDPKTGEYNKPFLKTYSLKEKATLIRGYSRLQGLIIRKDNLLNIKSLEDAIEKGAFFINRNPGSGTRILFDMLLEKIAEKRNAPLKELIKEIKGYEVEAKTHSAVASAVSMGKADIGIAIKTVWMFYENLEFIPLKEEKYDFLILNESMEKSSVKLFIETLKSEDFQKTAEKLEGIKTDKNTGKPLQ